MEAVVHQPNSADLPEWTRMRAALWPETSDAGHAVEVAAFLPGDLAGWLAGLKAVAGHGRRTDG